MASPRASRPCSASSTVAAFSFFSSARIFSAFVRSSSSSVISLPKISTSSASLSRNASSLAISLFMSSISTAARSRFFVDSCIALSHHAFWLASLDASCMSRSISSWISSLIFANGSAKMRLAKAVRSVLRKSPPFRFRRLAITVLPPSAAGPPRRFRFASCRNASGAPSLASVASASASRASMAPSLRATACATRTFTACWLKRIVLDDTLSPTAPLMIPITWLSVVSSA
mmetsp:Transcript_116050/g.374905  ORF Transcript_116050/g.374905 Transcript_116050/m.374905 type:complete len:231 (+) Transcript_116050:627-1319(+)